MDEECSGLEPAIARVETLSGLEPTMRARYVQLEGLCFELSGSYRFSGVLAGLMPSPEALAPVVWMGGEGNRHARVDLDAGTRVPLPGVSGRPLEALDHLGRYYVTEDEGLTLVRLTLRFEEDLRIALPGQRVVTIAPDGRILTWLFKEPDLIIYDAEGRLQSVVNHGTGAYAFAVDLTGALWFGDAAVCQVHEVCPETGGSLRVLDPKEDYDASNLFCFTYEITVDREDHLWTFNGQGDVGITIIHRDRDRYIRFASKDLGPEFEDCQPLPSPWHDEVYFLLEREVVVYKPTLVDWRPITSST